MRPSRLHILVIIFAGVALFLMPCLAFSGIGSNSPDAPHDNNAEASIGCLSCHDMLAFDQPNLIPDPGHVPLDDDDTLYNALCLGCHNGTDAPFAQTHSSLQTSKRYGDWTVECWVCHNQHSQAQLKAYETEAYHYTGTSNGITTTTITRSGASWTDDQFADMVVVPDISNTYVNYSIESNTADTLTVKGNIELSLVNIGDTFGINYGKFIRNSLSLDNITAPSVPKSGVKPVKFFNNTGNNSFADGNSTYNGICEVCHTLTTHFRNDGSGSDQLHTNVGVVAGTNCMTCHDHTNGFAHGGGSGTGCIDCHGHDAGTLLDPDMMSPYAPGATPSPGAGTFQSHSTHTEMDIDDLKGPGLYCDDCHDINNFPRFKDGNDLANTTVCNTCHSQNGWYDGINDPVIGAKTVWRSGVYIATDDSTLKSGREKWCAGCHDESASVIGVAAPNVIGDEDGSYTYGAGWGYYKTGHGLVADETYSSKGGVETLSGRPVECAACHDFSTAHIDGDARSFDCNDGCDSDEYRNSYRLQMVGSQNPMEVPWTGLGGSDATKFSLCTQVGCHDSGPFTDSGNPNTNLKTWASVEVSPGVWEDQWTNSHVNHLSLGNQNRYPADYVYDGLWDSRINCVTCHNVHGSTKLAMVRDGKLISREPGLVIYYRNDLTSYPTGPPTADPPVPADVPLSASNGTVWRGGTSVNLCSHCHANGNLTTVLRDPFQDVTQAPTLDWTGETGFVVDGANPDSGATGNSFTFRVKYTDTNNDPPSLIEVWIDLDNNGYSAGEKHTMAEVDAGDINYVDGKLYTFSTLLSNPGGNTKSYRFAASDGTVPATGPPASDGSVYIFNSSQGSGSAPILDWTGEAEFVSDGVHPDSGQNNDNFEFRVKYSDTDNDPPALIEVWTDMDLNNAYSTAEKITLTKVGAGTDYLGGEIYSSGIIPISCGDGCSLSYRFYATDGTNDATVNAPVLNSQIQLGNNMPELSWTGEVNYVDNGVDPESAAGGSNFIFRVDYTDIDNSAPSVIQAWVDLDNSNTYDNGEKITLVETDAGDTNYVDGKRYEETVLIPYVGDGIISYRFYGADNVDDASGDPTIDKTIETTPPVGNNVPSLSWATASCLSGGVRPKLGVAGGNFEFMVEYVDADNECPTGTNDIQVWVDANDNGSYDPDEKFDLAEDDVLDVNCVDGKLYKLTKSLQLAGDGVLNYRFYATDWKEVASGFPTSGSTVTVMVAISVRPAGSTLPYNYTSINTAAGTANGTILVYPNDDFSAATYSEQVFLNNRDNMNILSTCGPDLTTISYNSGNVFTVQDSANLVVDGFAVTSGNSGNGIQVNRVDGTVITFRDNKIFNTINGFYINDSDSQFVKIDNCEIYGNSFRGITMVSGDDWVDVKNSVIHSHNVTAGGAAVSINNGGQAKITKSVIRDNVTTVEGGAFYVNGGAANLTISNSLVIRNTAGTNGGVIRTNSGPTVNFINTTVANNQGTNGGVFYICTTGTTTIRNSIFWGNTSTSGNGANIYKVCGGGNIGTIQYSDINTASPAGISGATFTDGGGNINQDPFFDANYRLQVLSPAIDTGMNDGNTTVPADDIDNQTRGYDGDGAGTGTGDGSDYDMGADEYLP